MTITDSDLGVLGDLATALGILKDGSTDPGWFGDPAARIGTMLSDDDQRQALVSFLDDVLDDGAVQSDRDNRVRLPIVTHDDPNLTVAVVLQPTAQTVIVGLGVDLQTATTHTTLDVALFQTARGNADPPDPVLLLGQRGGRIRLATTVHLDAGTPPPGQFHLASIAVEVDVPTTDQDDAPALALTLGGLQLPGGTRRDLELSLSQLDQLDDTVLDLVLGLVRAQAATATGDFQALASLLGLGAPGAIPPLPIDQLAASGVAAITRWLNGVLADAASRAAWFTELAALIPGSAVAPTGDAVAVAVGDATFRLGLRSQSGPSGALRIVPTVQATLGSGANRVEAVADLLEADLGGGPTRALPRLALWANLGRSDGGAEPIVLDLPAADPVPAVRVEAVRAGVELNGDRRPVFVLAADRVTIGSHGYATLDLTSTDALMDAAGAAVEQIVSDLLAQLGGAAQVVRLLLGLDPPPNQPAVPTVSLAALAHDPLGAVAGYWRRLVTQHADAVPDLLRVVRDVLAADGAVAGDILGDGTEVSPWRIRLASGFELEAYATGTDLHVTAMGTTSVDTLGARCTVVEGNLGVELATIDLAAGHASVMTGLLATLSLRGRGLDPPRAVLDLGAVRIQADRVAVAIRWAPSGGLRFAVDAPNLVAVVDGTPIPLALPAAGAVDDAALAAIEALITVLAPLAPPWLAALAAAAGWTGPQGAARLGLTGLAGAGADPVAAIAAWLGPGLPDIGPDAVGFLADLLTGSGPLAGHLDGEGTPERPFELALTADGAGPTVLAWFPPAGPAPLLTAADDELVSWRPGDTGLATASLVQALEAEATVDAAVADLIWNRDVAAGLEGLVARWTGGDGRIVPPVNAPAGVDVIALDDVAAGQLADAIDLTDLLDHDPPATFHVVVAPSAAGLFPDAPPDRIIDLTAPNRAPETFTAPAPVAGEWFVALGTRDAARLATGDPDGTLGQSARLRGVLEAFAGLGTGQLVVGRAGAGQAARLAAAVTASVSDVVTLGTPYGPVSLTVLDEAAAGDAWRLLQDLLPATDPVADDADLGRGRALVQALAEVDASPDPAAELRVPAGGIPDRADLHGHAVFGVVREPAVRAAITAIVASGLATRAAARVATAVLDPPTGVRLGVRLPVAPAPTDRIVATGQVTVDLGGLDVGSGSITAATDHAVRVHLRIGVRDGWLAGGPDPLRGPTRSREHALRAVTVDVVVPRGAGSTATASARITLHDGRVFDVARERWDVAAGAEPVAAEVRLLLSLAAQRIAAEATATAPSPVAAALETALGALQLLAADGSVADAVEQLLHDPATLVAQTLGDATRRTQLATGARPLLGATGDGAVLRHEAAPVTVVTDLAAGSLTLDAPAGGGRFGWTAHVSLAPGAKDWSVRLGTDHDASPAGAAWLDIDGSHAVFRWRTAGAAQPTDVGLWPHLDATALVDALVHVAPALLAEAALELLRRADETARPVIDAVLDAFGLLGDDGVRLPAGLLRDPAGWLRHAGALGGQPARLVALLDALKPILGLTGGPGELVFAPGVTLSGHDAGGALELGAVVDTSQFTAPPAPPLGRLAAGLAASIRIPASGPTALTLDLHVGVDGAGPGRKAVHVSLDGGVRVFLRPQTGADVGLYPPGPGLAAAAAAGAIDAASHALPFLLDTLAAQAGPSLAGSVGALVAEIGDLLALRDQNHTFSYDRLTAVAADPVAALESASTSALAGAVPQLRSALAGVLPSGVDAQAVGQALQLTVGPVTLQWQPNPFRITVVAAAAGLPAIDRLGATLALTGSGVENLSVEVGPAPIQAGPVEVRPVLGVFAGSTPPGGRRVELGLDLDGTRHVVAQWLLDTGTVQLAVLDGTSPPVTDPATVAAGLAEAAATLAASIALATPEVHDLLAVPIGTHTVGELLHGVVLHDDNTLDPTLFAPDGLLARVVRLLDNLAGADLAVTIDSSLSVGIGKDGGGVIGITVGLGQRVPLTSGDVTVWLEADDTWIDPTPPVAGVVVGLAKMNGETVTVAPAITVSGLGIRIGKASGPLLDLGLTLESVAVHGYVALGATDQSGGVQLQFSNLAVAVSGATGGNAIASGILADSASGGQKPKPAFSPALAVQKHGTGPVEVTLRAGDGDGPWWIAIQKGFGPLYLEQVGFGVTMPQRKIESVSLLLDARVSLFGLTAAVDDLSITYFVVKGDVFKPENWGVDLGGLAIGADIGPLSISGGLLKSGSGDNVEYLGMLLGRFGVYGLTIYGGYGKTNGVVSFFAVGAVVGPIGGVPAFFVTGIGGGFGINRALVVPTDLSQFANYPLIRALDVAATASPDPMQELRQLGQAFPPQPGHFWFAAGLSFTSFALVDGIAVVAMQFGDGFEFDLLGLARMALPRPQFAIVSIELALVVRVSSKEGVIWVQGQLTDNSWLLYPDVRLTGGFAYVIWFAGPHRGEFVLTMGGFHPDFHRDGYPQVPRLGLQWRYGVIVVKGGSYYALTSEAVMAGVDVSISADFGCAWARLSFGAHGIVFFDPFHFRVDAYARISAGITIDTWFGDITFSISVGATVTLEGPDFHGRASVDVGPCDVTVEFGSSDDHTTPKLTAAQFVPKYLEEISSGVAQAISSIVSDGSVPPRPGTNGVTAEPPDGTAGRPFVVTAEFSMTVTTQVPATRLDVGGTVSSHSPTHALAIAPMQVPTVDPVLTLRWQQGATVLAWPFTNVTIQPYGSFPLGVWGPPQPADAPKVPKGEVVQALNQVTLTARATESAGGPPLDYNRLDPGGPRRPLPFLRNTGATRQDVVQAGQALVSLVASAAAGGDVPALADDWRQRAGASAIELASWQGERLLVGPRLGSLGDRLAPLDASVVPGIGAVITPEPVDTSVHPPVALAVLGRGTPLEGMAATTATTVSDRPEAARSAPPTVAGLRNVPAAARLLVTGGAAQIANDTVVPHAEPAVTRAARSVAASVARRGSAGRDRLAGITAAFGATPTPTGVAAGNGATTLSAGEVVVLALPNASHDVVTDGPRPRLVVKGTPTRVVALQPTGDVLVDQTTDGAEIEMPRGAERVALAPVGTGAQVPSAAGWHGAMTLPYVGWGTALTVDATVRFDGTPLTRRDDRYRAGWVEAAELVAGTGTVTTRFTRAVDVVVVVIDDPVTDDGRRLLLGLDGAQQAVGADGEPVPPTTVAAGNRAILAYAVEPDASAAAVAVTVASGTGWHVVGVLGTTGAPADVAAALAARGFDSALGAAAPPGRGQVTVAWEPAPPPDPTARKD